MTASQPATHLSIANTALASRAGNNVQKQDNGSYECQNQPRHCTNASRDIAEALVIEVLCCGIILTVVVIIPIFKRVSSGY